MAISIRRGALALAALAAAGAADAQGVPIRRAGLWETKVTAGFPGAQSTVRACIDPGADQRKMQELQARPPGVCGRLGPLTRTPTGWSFHYTCKAGPNRTVDFAGAIVGDYNSHYTTTMVQRMVPPPVPEMAKTTTVTDSRWLGPCPVGMKAGATTLNGRPARSRY